MYEGDIANVLITDQQIADKVGELAEQIAADRPPRPRADLLLVGVLKGAVMFVTDLSRAIPLPTQLEFMAVSSYGSSTSSSGVVRILKDLDRDINDRDVLIVEDIVDSGLTLTWPIPTQPATDQGILLAESWLAGEADGYLWTRLVHGRIEHMDNWRRMAFEIGFLTRLQQRLGRMPE